MFGMIMSADAQTKLKNILEMDEGYRQFVYKDTRGISTVAIGRNLESVGISHEEAMYLLQNDIRKAEQELVANWPYYKQLNDARQIVMVNLAFAMGAADLMQFKRMLGYIQANNWQMAAKELLASEWALQTGNRAQRLSLILERGSI